MGCIFQQGRNREIRVPGVLNVHASKLPAQRIVVAQADATRFAPVELFGRAAFDRVFFSYALSMIPDWRSAVARALDTLTADGALHIIDFGQCEDLPVAFRRVLFAWLARFSVTPIADFEHEVDRLAQPRGLSARVSHPYGGYAVRAVLSGVSRR
jgi:S-adenosylmethionine-diacylgycerolhomoserine-N-methlytransferase